MTQQWGRKQRDEKRESYNRRTRLRPPFSLLFWRSKFEYQTSITFTVAAVNVSYIMPAGMSWGRYMTFAASAIASMLLGASLVHSYYKPDLVSSVESYLVPFQTPLWWELGIRLVCTCILFQSLLGNTLATNIVSFPDYLCLQFLHTAQIKSWKHETRVPHIPKLPY